MKVLKFGGTSVGSTYAIQQVLHIIQKEISRHQSLVIIVSAMSGTTDKLINAGNLAAIKNEHYLTLLAEIETLHLKTAQELLPINNQSSTLSKIKALLNEVSDICKGIYLLQEFSAATKDALTAYGEIISSTLITAALNETINAKVHWADARLLIKTNNQFNNAVVNFTVTNALIKEYFSNHQLAYTIMPGFIASTENNITTTLGRGGSDYTAAIVGAALEAEVVEIWTDVDGMMTADPRLVENAKILPSVSYHEAMELSHFGAKVIYPPTLQPLRSKNIPVVIKNTFNIDAPGTEIVNKQKATAQIITGITAINNIALLSLEGSGMIGVPGFSKRLFEALSNEQINVILITQGSSENSICVGINNSFIQQAKQAVDKEFTTEITLQKIDPLQIETNLSIVALVGDGMKNHQAISGKMFDALGKNGINIRAIAQGSSERNISAVIQTKDVKKSINVLHEAFFESEYKQINIFLAGAGNVGSKLIEQIIKQQAYLKEQLKIKLNIAGIANSKRAFFNEQKTALDNWTEALHNAPFCTIQEYVAIIQEQNLPNSVFVDVTASDKVANVYEQLLSKSIAVVACNKIAASSNYNHYHYLKHVAKEFNTKFLFETNVGAGLPIIGTLNDLVKTGDGINKIEAVLSGTLNYVFNNYDGNKSFATIVKNAQDEGYTEPDPRLDLSGTDVMRKILILAREAGFALEMEDITNNSFLPQECMHGSVDDFYHSLEKNEPHFKNLLQAAENENCKLKFVATFCNGKASVGLQHIPPHSSLYHLYGKDNIVLFYTNRYADNPLIVKGAGAGADVTASGVFADIMRAV